MDLSIINEFYTKLPKWQKVALNYILSNTEISDQIISELVLLCKKEANNELNELNVSPVNVQLTAPYNRSIKLKRIFNINNINALSNSTCIDFNDNGLTVVYGNNGSGKSSFVRLIKYLAGFRNAEKPLPNIYSDNTINQSATIEYVSDDNIIMFEWTEGNHDKILSGIDIYDSSFGSIFIDKENETCFEPPILSLLTKLNSIREQVGAKLSKEEDYTSVRKLNFHPEYQQTDEAKWYDCINEETSEDEVLKVCNFTTENSSQLTRLKERLNEANPNSKISQLNNYNQYIDKIISLLNNISNIYSLPQLELLIDIRKQIEQKRTIAEQTVQAVSNKTNFNGIGTPTWIALWNAARKYSVEHAYIGLPFPLTSDGAHCVLCHQPLSPEAKDRLQSFDNYVISSAQKELVEVQSNYNNRVTELDILGTREDLMTLCGAAGIVDQNLISQISVLYDLFSRRKTQALSLNDSKQFNVINTFDNCIANLSAIRKNNISKISEYRNDLNPENIEKLHFEIHKLKTKQYFNGQREVILRELEIHKILATVKCAKKLTNSRALSVEKSRLSDELITNAFVERFNKELNNLGADHIQVRMTKTRTANSKIMHKVVFGTTDSKHNLSDVMSEGERKIISLAAFIADINGKFIKSPVIFDDPTTSLDISFENLIIKRLCQLSEDNQIIIFSHRLPVVTNISSIDITNCDYIYLQKINGQSGIKGVLPFGKLSVKKAIKELKNIITSQLQPAVKAQKYEQINLLTSRVCTDFRIIIERSIEDVLFCQIVGRFKPNISTLKLDQFKDKFTKEDVDIIHNLMTDYSYPQHSQSHELPVDYPDINKIEADILNFEKWVNEYSRRNN